MESLRKGLKKGDLFEDGGRVFVVVEVNQDGTYLSELWCPNEKEGAAVESSEDTAAGCEKANLDPQDLENWSLKELKKLAKDMGLSTSGTKAELVERIAAEEVEFDPDTKADRKDGEETGNGPEEETEE